MKPVVSVVIPTYNRARELEVALSSVRNQSYEHWEALVVDNHSTDHTREVIGRANDRRFRYFEIANNGVIAASRNLGIRQAIGEFVAFLDSDDYWKRDKLERSIRCLEKGYDVIYHDMHIVSSRYLWWGARTFRTRQLSPPIFADLLVGGNTLPTSSVVARKDILLEVGGFREDSGIIAGEDYDLWLRLSKVTERFKRVEGRIGYLTRGGNNEFSAGRVISILSKIEEEHLAFLSRNERAQAHINWIDYGRGRARYKQGQHDLAKGYLGNVLCTSPRISLRVKAGAMLCAIAARRAFRARP